MRARHLIHQTKTDDFKEWLETQGLTILPGVGTYEVFRAVKEGEPPVIFHKRDRTDHLTTQGKGLRLALEFLRRKETTHDHTND